MHGVVPDHSEKQLFAAIAAIISAADARIWPIKLGRIVATLGNPLAGVAASFAASEGLTALGPWTAKLSAEFQQGMLGEVDRGLTIDAAVQSARHFVGWGVPLRKHDERYQRLHEEIVRLGRSERKFWRFHLELCDVIRRTRGIEPNISAGIAAALLDVGIMSPMKIGVLATSLCVHIFAAHAVESAEQGYEAYRSLPRDDVEYIGVPPRPVPIP